MTWAPPYDFAPGPLFARSITAPPNDKKKQKNSFWKMTRPKEWICYTYNIYIQNLNHLVRILNVNNEGNICDKNNTNIYAKAFESWVTRISIVVVVSARLTDTTLSHC